MPSVHGHLHGGSLGSACAQEQDGGRLEPLGEGVVAAAASIAPDDYLRKLGVIAHDSMGGRDTPSPGLEMTAAWIASEFERVGLVPAGDDGSYVQRYLIEAVAPDLVASSAKVNGGGDLRFGRDLVIAAASEGDVEGEVVMLAGMGDMTPEAVSRIVGQARGRGFNAWWTGSRGTNVCGELACGWSAFRPRCHRRVGSCLESIRGAAFE